ncbi:MAG TPA: Uma2 family endonuclease [Planctomycetaceae bacterium]
MRGILLEVPEHLLAARRASGADRWDEMWDGVLHMNPPPNLDHQKFEHELEGWLDQNWGIPQGGAVYHNVGVARPGQWPRDYRAPDLVLVGPDRLDRLRETHVEGGPTVAVEIRSPGDETYEKFEFYASVGTAEVWVIDRDTKRPEVYVLGGQGYESRPADAEGWVVSPATGVRLCPQPGNRIGLRFDGDEASAAEPPER